MLHIKAIQSILSCHLAMKPTPLQQSNCNDFLTSKISEGLFTLVTKGLDQSFSCIVIGGKVGAGPSSLYTIKSDQGLQWMKK
jgi:hypothetical protein